MVKSVTKNQALYCGLCGVYLGTGVAGAVTDCWKCGQSVITKTSQGNIEGALRDLVALGLGLAFAMFLLHIIGTLSD